MKNKNTTMKKTHFKKNRALVMVTLMLMISTTLLANGTAATATAQMQSAGRVAIELGVLLFFILSPLFIKRPKHHTTVK
jgi:hypothetical protein